MANACSSPVLLVYELWTKCSAAAEENRPPGSRPLTRDRSSFMSCHEWGRNVYYLDFLCLGAPKTALTFSRICYVASNIAKIANGCGLFVQDLCRGSRSTVRSKPSQCPRPPSSAFTIAFACLAQTSTVRRLLGKGYLPRNAPFSANTILRGAVCVSEAYPPISIALSSNHGQEWLPDASVEPGDWLSSRVMDFSNLPPLRPAPTRNVR